MAKMTKRRAFIVFLVILVAGSSLLMFGSYRPSRIEQRPAGAMPAQTSAATKILFDTALESDFLFWVAPRIIPNAVLRGVLGTPPSVLRNGSAEERARIARVRDHIQPLSRRRLGLLNDASITGSLPRYELERIAAPTLIVGLADCLFGTYAGARYCAEHIPHARFVGYTTGGHLRVGHQEDVFGEIAGFLRASFRPPGGETEPPRVHPTTARSPLPGGKEAR